MQQLGELQNYVPALERQADVYVINRDAPEQVAQLRQMNGTTLPILYDRDLDVARQYDMLPKRGQPMGGMPGVGQMGFVIIDAEGIIQAQRVDLYFGRNAEQILEILESLETE